MKKILVYVITGIIALSMVSCGAKKAETLEDLKAKYDGKTFKNCDDFLAAGEEIIDVFVLIIDKAAEGDEKAMEEIEAMEAFMGQFDEQAEKFEEECPEKFEAFQKTMEEKMEAAMEKLFSLMFGDMDFGADMDWDEDYDWDEDFDWDEEVEVEEVE